MTAKIVIVLFLLLGGFVLGIKVEGWRGAAIRETIAATEAALREERLLTNAMIGELAALREEKQRVVYRKVTERLTELVPVGGCELSAGWRVQHDASAMRQDPAPGPVDHAAPVSAQDAARTVAANYEEHHRVADRLEDCQRYVRDVVRPAGLSGESQ